MRQKLGGAMVRNGKGIGNPNSALKVSSQSAVLEERESESDRRNTRQKKRQSCAAVTLSVCSEVASRGLRRTRTRSRRKRDGKLWRWCHDGR